MGTHRIYRERNYVFGQQVLAYRTRAALTQIELADQIGVHRRSVQNWEAGESYPKPETLQRLIVVLLRHQAFTSGQEREELLALWQQAAADGPHQYPAFDEAWFAALRAPAEDKETRRRGDGKCNIPPSRSGTQPPTPIPHPPTHRLG